MRVLITGGTGFIGRNLVPTLTRQHDVTLLVRESYGMGQPLPSPLATLRDQLSLVYADLRNFRLTTRAVAEAAPDVVVHLAAAGVTDRLLPLETALRHNVHGSLHLMRACFERGGSVRRLIIGRTPGERQQMNVYATSKMAAWQFAQMYVRTQQWPIVGAMLFQVYGPFQPDNMLIPAALRAATANLDFPMTSGQQAKDWIAVQDVVAGIERMISAELRAGTTVELGSGTTTTVADVVRLIFKLTNSSGRPQIGALPARVGETAVQQADSAQTYAQIGWRSSTKLEHGLQQLAGILPA